MRHLVLVDPWGMVSKKEAQEGSSSVGENSYGFLKEDAH